MKKYLLSLLLSACLYGAVAQVSIQPVLPPGGIIQKNNLWNIAVINTSPATLECRIELTLRDRASGLEVLTATTGQFSVASGARQLNASFLMPIQYNYLSSSVNSRNDEFIPIGDYTACYRLSANKNIIAEECVSFDVEPLSPPMLINPADSSALETAPSQFTWIPPSPINLFNRLQYEVMITEILPGQKAEEAMQQNLPFYTEPNVPINNLTYRGMATDFEIEKWYAWQVVARDDNNYAGKSEVFVFKVNKPSITEMLIKLAPFTKMKKNDPEKGSAPNGILKLSYVNETTDKEATINITDLTKTENKMFQFSVPLKEGENLIEYNVLKKFKLEENRVYRVEIVNSRKEIWSLLFEIHIYKEKTQH